MPGQLASHKRLRSNSDLRICRVRSPANVLWPSIESVPSLRICHSQTDWNLLKMHNLILTGGSNEEVLTWKRGACGDACGTCDGSGHADQSTTSSAGGVL